MRAVLAVAAIIAAASATAGCSDPGSPDDPWTVEEGPFWQQNGGLLVPMTHSPQGRQVVNPDHDQRILDANGKPAADAGTLYACSDSAPGLGACVDWLDGDPYGTAYVAQLPDGATLTFQVSAEGQATLTRLIDGSVVVFSLEIGGFDRILSVSEVRGDFAYVAVGSTSEGSAVDDVSVARLDIGKGTIVWSVPVIAGGQRL
jgi:hypothetical protein